MDFMTHLPKTRAGYDSLLVIVDYVTKMMILRPTHSIATAVDTARIFMDAVCCEFLVHCCLQELITGYSTGDVHSI